MPLLQIFPDLQRRQMRSPNQVLSNVALQMRESITAGQLVFWRVDARPSDPDISQTLVMHATGLAPHHTLSSATL